LVSTIDFMAELRKPRIAFRVLAFGTIHAHDAIRCAFESGADFKFYTSSSNRIKNGVYQLDQELTYNKLKENIFDLNSKILLVSE
jgi:hypothetical protein